jgi:DnaJ-class molecular chaperone
MKDYYEILGVPRNASQNAIKQAFRTLAPKHHPDVSTAENSANLFKEISEAYETLRDPSKRSDYDLAQKKAVVVDLETSVKEVVGEFFNKFHRV